MIYLKDTLIKLIGVLLCIIILFAVHVKYVSTDDKYEDKVSFSEAALKAQEKETGFYTYDSEDTIVARDDDTRSVLFPDAQYFLCIDDTDGRIICAKNAHRRMYPASMTKLVTALVCCDYIESGEVSLSDEVTVETYYDLSYDGVEPPSLYPGYTISMKDLMYGLMIGSNNYYSLILGEYLCGSPEAFVNKMNEKVWSLGATNSHFENPHGLDDPDHYSTAYDMYLIIREASKHELLNTIDAFKEYEYSYKDENGNVIDDITSATNLFLTDRAQLPAGYTLHTWKTGTTDGAGYALAMVLEKDGHTYITVGATLDDRIELYDYMVKALCLE
ncbi:MAG: D-alanyl-D-alanine carboxypeptidase [Lachnospiraceae bacterium]|nr:D-alanyl-D-alanine carboxypeptidase [Lachnospiraceae bacterium]